jgi:hypothetical protein
MQGLVTMYEHLLDKKQMIIETRDLMQKIACSTPTRTFKSKGGEMVSSFVIDKNHEDSVKLISNLTHLYHDCGMGFKLLSKELGNVSYTRLRTIFRSLGITKRDGKSCVTEGLKKLRSENAKKDNPWSDCTSKYPDKDKVNKHHLGGWYLNKSTNKNVWLRSSWEYGYAAWLDSQLLSWDVEIRSYLLSDGRYYRPDFFIFVNNCLDHIVEIKSRWSNGALDRIDKFTQFENEYPGIKTKLITDELFDLIGKNQAEVLTEWKKIRILELTK